MSEKRSCDLTENAEGYGRPISKSRRSRANETLGGSQRMETEDRKAEKWHRRAPTQRIAPPPGGIIIINNSAGGSLPHNSHRKSGHASSNSHHHSQATHRSLPKPERTRALENLDPETLHPNKAFTGPGKDDPLNNVYPPIITIDGRVDTDLDHLIDDDNDDDQDYMGPVDEIPNRYPKPHVFSVIHGSLDDDVDSYANDDGTMEHTLVDAPKSFHPRDLKDVASFDSGGPQAKPGHVKGGSCASLGVEKREDAMRPGVSMVGSQVLRYTDRSHNKMSTENLEGEELGQQQQLEHTDLCQQQSCFKTCTDDQLHKETTQSNRIVLANQDNVRERDRISAQVQSMDYLVSDQITMRPTTSPGKSQSEQNQIPRGFQELKDGSQKIACPSEQGCQEKSSSHRRSVTKHCEGASDSNDDDHTFITCHEGLITTAGEPAAGVRRQVKLTDQACSPIEQSTLEQVMLKTKQSGRSSPKRQNVGVAESAGSSASGLDGFDSEEPGNAHAQSSKILEKINAAISPIIWCANRLNTISTEIGLKVPTSQAGQPNEEMSKNFGVEKTKDHDMNMEAQKNGAYQKQELRTSGHKHRNMLPRSTRNSSQEYFDTLENPESMDYINQRHYFNGRAFSHGIDPITRRTYYKIPKVIINKKLGGRNRSTGRERRVQLKNIDRCGEDDSLPLKEDQEISHDYCLQSRNNHEGNRARNNPKCGTESPPRIPKRSYLRNEGWICKDRNRSRYQENFGNWLDGCPSFLGKPIRQKIEDAESQWSVDDQNGASFPSGIIENMYQRKLIRNKKQSKNTKPRRKICHSKVDKSPVQRIPHASWSFESDRVYWPRPVIPYKRGKDLRKQQEDRRRTFGSPVDAESLQCFPKNLMNIPSTKSRLLCSDSTDKEIDKSLKKAMEIAQRSLKAAAQVSKALNLVMTSSCLSLSSSAATSSFQHRPFKHGTGSSATSPVCGFQSSIYSPLTDFTRASRFGDNVDESLAMGSKKELILRSTMAPNNVKQSLIAGSRRGSGVVTPNVKNSGNSTPLVGIYITGSTTRQQEQVAQIYSGPIQNSFPPNSQHKYIEVGVPNQDGKGILSLQLDDKKNEISQWMTAPQGFQQYPQITQPLVTNSATMEYCLYEQGLRFLDPKLRSSSLSQVFESACETVQELSSKYGIDFIPTHEDGTQSRGKSLHSQNKSSIVYTTRPNVVKAALGYLSMNKRSFSPCVALREKAAPFNTQSNNEISIASPDSCVDPAGYQKDGSAVDPPTGLQTKLTNAKANETYIVPVKTKRKGCKKIASSSTSLDEFICECTAKPCSITTISEREVTKSRDKKISGERCDSKRKIRNHINDKLLSRPEAKPYSDKTPIEREDENRNCSYQKESEKAGKNTTGEKEQYTGVFENGNNNSSSGDESQEYRKFYEMAIKDDRGRPGVVSSWSPVTDRNQNELLSPRYMSTSFVAQGDPYLSYHAHGDANKKKYNDWRKRHVKKSLCIAMELAQESLSAAAKVNELLNKVVDVYQSRNVQRNNKPSRHRTPFSHNLEGDMYEENMVDFSETMSPEKVMYSKPRNRRLSRKRENPRATDNISSHHKSVNELHVDFKEFGHNLHSDNGNESGRDQIHENNNRPGVAQKTFKRCPTSERDDNNYGESDERCGSPQRVKGAYGAPAFVSADRKLVRDNFESQYDDQNKANGKTRSRSRNKEDSKDDKDCDYQTEVTKSTGFEASGLQMSKPLRKQVTREDENFGDKGNECNWRDMDEYQQKAIKRQGLDKSSQCHNEQKRLVECGETNVEFESNRSAKQSHKADDSNMSMDNEHRERRHSNSSSVNRKGQRARSRHSSPEHYEDEVSQSNGTKSERHRHKSPKNRHCSPYNDCDSKHRVPNNTDADEERQRALRTHQSGPGNCGTHPRQLNGTNRDRHRQKSPKTRHGSPLNSHDTQQREANANDVGEQRQKSSKSRHNSPRNGEILQRQSSSPVDMKGHKYTKSRHRDSDNYEANFPKGDDMTPHVFVTDVIGGDSGLCKPVPQNSTGLLKSATVKESSVDPELTKGKARERGSSFTNKILHGKMAEGESSNEKTPHIPLDFREVTEKVGKRHRSPHNSHIKAVNSSSPIKAESGGKDGDERIMQRKEYGKSGKERPRDHVSTKRDCRSPDKNRRHSKSHRARKETHSSQVDDPRIYKIASSLIVTPVDYGENVSRNRSSNMSLTQLYNKASEPLMYKNSDTPKKVRQNSINQKMADYSNATPLFNHVVETIAMDDRIPHVSKQWSLNNNRLAEKEAMPRFHEVQSGHSDFNWFESLQRINSSETNDSDMTERRDWRPCQTIIENVSEDDVSEDVYRSGQVSTFEVKDPYNLNIRDSQDLDVNYVKGVAETSSALMHRGDGLNNGNKILKEQQDIQRSKSDKLQPFEEFINTGWLKQSNDQWQLSDQSFGIEIPNHFQSNSASSGDNEECESEMVAPNYKNQTHDKILSTSDFCKQAEESTYDSDNAKCNQYHTICDSPSNMDKHVLQNGTYAALKPMEYSKMRSEHFAMPSQNFAQDSSSSSTSFSPPKHLKSSQWQTTYDIEQNPTARSQQVNGRFLEIYSPSSLSQPKSSSENSVESFTLSTSLTTPGDECLRPQEDSSECPHKTSNNEDFYLQAYKKISRNDAATSPVNVTVKVNNDQLTDPSDLNEPTREEVRGEVYGFMVPVSNELLPTSSVDRFDFEQNLSQLKPDLYPPYRPLNGIHNANLSPIPERSEIVGITTDEYRISCLHKNMNRIDQESKFNNFDVRRNIDGQTRPDDIMSSNTSDDKQILDAALFNVNNNSSSERSGQDELHPPRISDEKMMERLSSGKNVSDEELLKWLSRRQALEQFRERVERRKCFRPSSTEPIPFCKFHRTPLPPIKPHRFLKLSEPFPFLDEGTRMKLKNENTKLCKTIMAVRKSGCTFDNGRSASPLSKLRKTNSKQMARAYELKALAEANMEMFQRISNKESSYNRDAQLKAYDRMLPKLLSSAKYPEGIKERHKLKFAGYYK